MSRIETHDVEGLVERLRGRYPDLAEAEVREAVLSAFRKLEDARLRQFEFLIVEKNARDACRERRGGVVRPVALAVIRSG